MNKSVFLLCILVMHLFPTESNSKSALSVYQTKVIQQKKTKKPDIVLKGVMAGFPIEIDLYRKGSSSAVPGGIPASGYVGIYKNIKYNTTMKIEGCWFKGYYELTGKEGNVTYTFSLDDSDCDDICYGTCRTNTGKEFKVKVTATFNKK